MPHSLFCYGTLCIPTIMRRVCGRLPSAAPAELVDYACYALRGRAYPGLVPRPGSRVTGLVYSGLGAAQLARLDAYEGHEYRRQRVWLRSAAGTNKGVWTYVLQPRYYHLLVHSSWSLEHFAQAQLQLYLQRNRNKPVAHHGRDPD